MATFEGTSDEFIKFIGGYTRNKVQSITRTYRKNIGKCEDCGSRTKKLDAAHIKGKERPIITSNILNNFIYDGKIKIDLQVFEDQFISAHKSLPDSIKILCKECHREYDKQENIIEIEDELEDDIDNDKIDQQEMEIVSGLIANSKMNKSKALPFFQNRVNDILNNSNVVYSNVNNTVNVWWLEPANEKFKTEFFIVLNNSDCRKLLLFQIPKNEIENPELVFEQRSDKGVSKIIIIASETEYKDKKGFDFKPYLIQTVEY
ncbi:MAG: hypothetical protein WCH34_07515 [Bacteroidota bacterium]